MNYSNEDYCDYTHTTAILVYSINLTACFWTGGENRKAESPRNALLRNQTRGNQCGPGVSITYLQNVINFLNKDV